MTVFVSETIPNPLAVWAVVIASIAVPASVFPGGALLAFASLPMALVAARRRGRPRTSAIVALVLSGLAISIQVAILIAVIAST